MIAQSIYTGIEAVDCTINLFEQPSGIQGDDQEGSDTQGSSQQAFGELGFTAATVKDVAGRAKVSFGLVSHYFGSKQDLFLAAGFDMADRLVEQLTAATAGEGNGLEKIRAYMAAYFEFTEKHRKGFPILLRCSPFSHMDPGVDGAKVAEKFSVFIEELKRCVSLGMADGSIRKLPTEKTALIIYGNNLWAASVPAS